MRVRNSLFLLAFSLSVAACADKATPAPETAPSPTAPAAEAAAPSAAQPAPSRTFTPEEAQAIGNRVAKTIATRYPGVQVTQVARVDGLEPSMYRVTIGDKFAYTNDAADFFLVGGELLVGKSDGLVNVTKADAINEGTKIYNSMPFDQALKKVYGTGERQLVVFSDPDCPFCQQLEVMFKENESNLNATVYTLLYPLDSLHPNADAKARQILCTPDPGKAWEEWMLAAAAAKDEAAVTAAWDAWSKRNPAPTDCPRAAAVDAAKKVGYDLGFNETPTLVFANGMPWRGILSRTELEQAWNYVKANPQPPTDAPAAPSPAP